MKDNKYYRWWWLRRTDPAAGDELPPGGSDPDAGRQLERIWEASEAYGRSFQPDEAVAWQHLHSRLHQRPRHLRMHYRQRWAAAAAVLLLVAAGLYWLNRPAETLSYRTITTLVTKQTVTLPDGSRVAMNRNSRLRYAVDFSTPPHQRAVEFSGEGFFEIVPDTERPFVIATDLAEVTVMGTTFNLRALPQDSMFEVDVETGRVALRSLLDPEREPLEVRADHCGIVTRTTERPELRAASTPNRHAWRTGRLVFSNTPLSEALYWLERAYGIRFRFPAEAINDCPITTTLEEVDLQTALRQLSDLTGARFGSATDETIPLLTGCAKLKE